jgi:hypothetical protein
VVAYNSRAFWFAITRVIDKKWKVTMINLAIRLDDCRPRTRRLYHKIKETRKNLPSYYCFDQDSIYFILKGKVYILLRAEREMALFGVCHTIMALPVI